MIAKFSPSAIADLKQMFIDGAYKHGFDQAYRYEKEINFCINNLAQTPHMYAPREEFNSLRKDIRVFTYKKHSIVYHPIDEGIRVVRVAHGHDNWQRDLGKHM